ncbi:MAG: hypothetical protein Q8R02_09420 [Hyphomonadaceae bacterium]|nr:hypothetical protein [Hyphomonadaceae bacterium]
MRLALSAGIALMAACAAASAQQAKDGEVEVLPGKWTWKQSTTVIGFINSKDENLECLIPQKAKVKLSELARDLDEDCTVDKVAPIPDGYSFKLICKGDLPIRADATLAASDRSMVIRAKGSATVMGFIPASVSANADASLAGECTSEEIAKETERWRLEQQ